MELKERLRTFLKFAKSAGCQRLCIAYSGGVDSHLLLVLLNELNQGINAIPLDAIYINHNLHHDSQRWGEHCRLVCKHLDIEFQQLDVDAAAEKGESPEEKARDARYHALGDKLQANQWLLTAQHRDDQAETLLLQLLRGSGVYGLAAMPEQRTLGMGELHRPLLKISRQQIEETAKQYQLKWVEDPSNQQQTIPRNYLRKTVVPALQELWPETNLMLDRSAGWIAEAADLLAEFAEIDFQNCIDKYQSINIRALQQLSFNRQKNLLRYWFHHLKLKRPGNEKLTLIFEQIVNARTDANPQLDWQGVSLRRYKGHLYIVPAWPEPEPDWELDWNANNFVNLPDNSGVLSVSEKPEQGLSMSTCQQGLTIRMRRGGERCHPLGRGHSQSLKKLFQEYSVPPWLRNRWPLLYCGELLVAVPGLFVCKGFEAEEHKSGLLFSVKFNTT